jgi:triphosphoribosyl-dephospho-CoA synthase
MMRSMLDLSPGRIAELACILEATARKPGNVHRTADFEDTCYLDYLLSATAIVEPLDRARSEGVGWAVLRAIEATRRVVTTNTNLGMVLLFAPLAAVPEGEPLQAGVRAVLERLTVGDAEQVYRAIRLARPGGLGTVPEQDIASEPTVPLREVMSLAADRDLVARQYANGYFEVFTIGAACLQAALEEGHSLEFAITFTFVILLKQCPDTLIARKRGVEVAREASRRAADVIESGAPIHELDVWLRADGHARNPGACADLVAAALFVALRDGQVPLPRPSGASGWADPIKIV